MKWLEWANGNADKVVQRLSQAGLRVTHMTSQKFFKSTCAFTLCPSDLTLGIHPKEAETYIHTKTWLDISVHSNFAYSSKNLERTKCFCNRQLVKHIVVHPCCGILPGNQKEELLICAATWLDLKNIKLNISNTLTPLCSHLITFSNDSQSWKMDGHLEELRKR